MAAYFAVCLEEAGDDAAFIASALGLRLDVHLAPVAP